MLYCDVRPDFKRRCLHAHDTHPPLNVCGLIIDKIQAKALTPVLSVVRRGTMARWPKLPKSPSSKIVKATTWPHQNSIQCEKRKKIQKGKIEKELLTQKQGKLSSCITCQNQIWGHMQLLYFVPRKGYGNTSLWKGIVLTGLYERQTNRQKSK